MYVDTVAAEGHTALIRSQLWLVRKIFLVLAVTILAGTALSYRDYAHLTYSAMARSVLLWPVHAPGVDEGGYELGEGADHDKQLFLSFFFRCWKPGCRQSVP